MKLGPIQEKWLQSLEQNPERQHKGSLGVKTEDGYKTCCLGELGIIAGKCRWIDNKLADGTNLFTLTSAEEIGLYDEVGVTKDGQDSLASMNDKSYTWPDIAQIVRANPENFFSKSF